MGRELRILGSLDERTVRCFFIVNFPSGKRSAHCVPHMLTPLRLHILFIFSRHVSIKTLMNSRDFSFIAVCAALTGLLASSVYAAGGGGEYAPVIELGMNFHNGITGTSVTGANGYFVNFRSEKRKGFFHPYVAAEFESSSGKASIGADTPAFSMYSTAFLGGVHLFLFQTGRFQPFFGGSGVFAWHFMKLPSPPTSVEPYSQSLSYGYEASTGVDIRLGSVEGNALRLRGGYWAVTSLGLAGISSFQQNGFRFTVGIVY